MSKAMAILAGVTTVAFVGGTFAVTQFAARPDCGLAPSGDIGGPFTLMDEMGRTVTEAEVIAEPSLIYFGYTFCPDVCPLDNARNAAAVDILADEGLSVTPVFISIDPTRDTVEVVRDYTDNFHPKMIGLTGTEEQVAAASAAYRTFFEKEEGDDEYYLVQHSTSTYLVLPDEGVATFFGRDDSPEHIAQVTACVVAG
ncbi:SCO family protein [Loktanella sp. S4079]|uniref:SCO family protein n=1 Tax=Loktanella sp. S4079 TaxID=579483 RepID=UPI0005FA8A91|nr:SCO family protein [Loktanella sp. S4079]KJZ19436.1 protein senC [Loktanella sp. S4079]